jgi:hypothetical protein
VNEFPVIDAAKAIIRAELDLYAATQGHPRPVTSYDLRSGYEAAWRAMGWPDTEASRVASRGEGT